LRVCGAADLVTPASAGVATATVIALAETIFAFTDELAADVVEGYLRMQSDEAGERERRRRRLAALLLDPTAAIRRRSRTPLNWPGGRCRGRSRCPCSTCRRRERSRADSVWTD
jgi:hypothetical protein